MFSIHSEAPLPVPGAEFCLGLAYDGQRYYLPLRQGVAVLDGTLNAAEPLHIRRPYTALCFDPLRRCFWAASDQFPATLFRLDGALRETGRVKLPGGCPVSALSFCPGSGDLLLARGNTLLELSPEDAKTRLLRTEPGDTLLLAAVCLPDRMLCRALRRGGSRWLSMARGGAVPEDAAGLPPADGAAWDLQTGELLLLTHRRGVPQLLRARPDGACPSAGDRDGVLSSVALVETALARLLDAAGERLRAADPGDLPEANESLRQTLLYAAQVEQTLLAQLTELGDLPG